MAANWSRLHEVLGLQPGPLTYADIQIIERNVVAEETGLDWKAQRSKDDGFKTELAKDLAV